MLIMVKNNEKKNIINWNKTVLINSIHRMYTFASNYNKIHNIIDISFNYKWNDVLIKNIPVKKFSQYERKNELILDDTIAGLIKDLVVNLYNKWLSEYDFSNWNNNKNSTELRIKNEFDLLSINDIVKLIRLSEKKEWIIYLLTLLEEKQTSVFTVINNVTSDTMNEYFVELSKYFLQKWYENDFKNWVTGLITNILKVLNIDVTFKEILIKNPDILKKIKKFTDISDINKKLDELSNNTLLLWNKSDDILMNYERIDIYDNKNIDLINNLLINKKITLKEQTSYVNIDKIEKDELNEIDKIKKIFELYIKDIYQYILLITKTKVYSRYWINDIILPQWWTKEYTKAKDLIYKFVSECSNGDITSFFRSDSHFRMMYRNYEEFCKKNDNKNTKLIVEYFNNINTNLFNGIWWKSVLELSRWSNIFDVELVNNAKEIVFNIVWKNDIMKKNDILYNQIISTEIENKKFISDEGILYNHNYGNHLNPVYKYNMYLKYDLWFSYCGIDLWTAYIRLLLEDFIIRYVDTWKIKKDFFNDLLINFSLVRWEKWHWLSMYREKEILDEFLFNDFEIWDLSQDDFENKYLRYFKKVHYNWNKVLFYFKATEKWKLLMKMKNIDNDLLIRFIFD